ncbi:MAG: phosphonate C-P lyase system protein PhnH, partial [Pseudomonadota bacterium]
MSGGAFGSGSLSGGFAAPAVDAARAFRAALEAMARPGRIETIAGAAPPAPLSAAAGALILTLCDGETPLHLAGAWDAPAIRAWVAFHAGSPIVAAKDAAFALGDWASLAPLDRFAVGTPEYPDRSASLIVETERLDPSGARLTGPGIETEARLSLPEAAAFQANAALYPLGLDFWFTCGDRLAALPRTTR